ncbi:MAG: MG2 domain-containing protein, partial [Acidobacteria bacterium]|nr:MG2 domain-containing protein [Acidobacteriota bacterium]
MLLRDGPARITLPVFNSTNQPMRAEVNAELLDPPGNFRSQDSLFVILQPGANNVSIPLRLPFGSLESNLRRESFWYRLRYSIRPDDAETPATRGLLSLPQIAPDFFLLKLTAPLWARPGHPFPVRVRALHPVTDLPVVGVSLKGTIGVEYAASSSQLRAEAVTSADGMAELLFHVPAGIIGTDVELEVEGRLGEFVTAATEDFHTGRWADLLIHTDKPVYQPGQILHLRLLARDYALNRPLPRTKLVLRIEDPERVVVFRQGLETSTYGIAHTDWPIPENLRLGDYLVQVESDDESHEDFGSAVSIRISRYELPTFSVSVTPDRPYYLPDQDATVEVRAEYLWGEPVRRGRVRVARQTSREWDYFRQEWETEE